MKRLVVVVSAVATVAVWMHATAAHACGNSMRHEERLLMATSPEEKLLKRAQREFAQKRYAQALESGKELIELKTPLHQKWGHRIAGLSALQLGNYQVAQEHLTEAASLFEQSPMLLTKLAEAEVGLAQYDAAIGRLDKLGDLLDADGFVVLARARMGKSDRDGALAAVKQALEMNPRHKGALGLRDELEGKPQQKKKALPTKKLQA